MRVRLYEIGTSSVGFVVRFDELPVVLTLDEAGELHVGEPVGKPLCQFEDFGGQLMLRTDDPHLEMDVNDAPLESGPVMPGDRLRVGQRRFLVSYERTADAPQPISRYRILAGTAPVPQ